MAPENGISHGVSRKPGRLLEYTDLTATCGQAMACMRGSAGANHVPGVLVEVSRFFQ